MESSFRSPSHLRSSSESAVRKSVQLLDEALNSPLKSTLRTSKTTPLRTLIHKRRDSVASDRSVALAFGDVSNSSSRVGDVSFNLDESTDYSIAVSMGQEPWKEVLDGLFMDFLRSTQSHSSERQIFETIADYIENCSNTLDLLKDMELKIPERAGFKMKIQWLSNERETWRLIYALYKDRLSSGENEMEQDESALRLVSAQHLSEKEAIQELYKNDRSIRECQLVVDWLEQNALIREEGALRIHHYTDKIVAWENTLHQLKNEGTNISYLSSRPLLDKLDPDAPLRERKPLHDLDMDDETKLIKDVFMEIRCGRLEEAQNLCFHCGQPWRAAALEGWRLYHDPNYSIISNTGEKQPVEGNPNRDLWKLMAWRLASDPRLPLFSRATHAVYCGHLKALEPVCQSWADVLWAHLRVLIDVRVEKEIRASVLRSYIDMPEEYWQNKLTLQDVFTNLGAHKRKDISLAATNPDHLVQKHIILNQIPALVECMLEWISTADPQFLRFMAHLVLFFRTIGYSEAEDVGDRVLEAYVKALIQMGDPQLVACYVASLPQGDQVHLYAQFLEKVTEEGDRSLCLKSAEDAGLDVETITKRVVENIRNKVSVSSKTDLHPETSPEDLEKISALEWLTFYPSQRAEALYQTNAVIRHFLAAGKLEASRKAFNKIPVDSIDIIIKSYHPGVTSEGFQPFDVDTLPYRVACAVREYLCHRTYLDAEEGFSDWFHHYHSAKPQKPTQPTGDVPFTEKVAYDHKKAQYLRELDIWRNSMRQQTKMVKTQLLTVLTFPEGGWLVDVEPKILPGEEEPEMNEEWKCRLQQMENLRKLCLPKVVLLLVSMLQKMEEYEECLELAELIVSEQRQIYKVYTSQKLQELMQKFLQCSLELLKKKKDPFGIPASF